MPNHIKNKIRIFDSDEEIKKIMDFIRGAPNDDGSECIIDFNKIIPMPAALKVDISIKTEDAVKNALLMRTYSKVSPLELDDEEWELFIQCLKNVRNFGYISWYDWSSANWGTKWNAYDYEKISDNSFVFQTAWNPVVDLIIELSKKFPTAKFFYQFACEDMSSKCGEGYIKSGVSEIKYLNYHSIEAYELAFQLFPDDKKDYIFEDGKYRYIGDDI